MNKHCVRQLNAFLELQNINDIIEITYAYHEIGKGRFFNKTIFEKFARISRELWKEKKYDYYTIRTIVKRKLESVREGLGDFNKENHYENINTNYRYLLDRAIKYMQKVIDLTITGLPFEIEKTGMKIPLTPYDRSVRLGKIKKFEKQLFGEECQTKTFEINEAYILLMKFFHLHQHKTLTAGDKRKYKELVNKIKEIPGFSLTNKQIENRLKNLKIKGLFSELEYKKLFNVKIPRKDYLEIFKLAFKIYDIKRDIITDERSSIYDGYRALFIPKDVRYRTLSLKRTITLIAHEIETHYLIDKNHRKLFDEVRGGWNLPKEEGLAMIHEWLIKEKDINEFTVTSSVAFSLMAEILTKKELNKFLLLFYKMMNTDVDYKKEAKMRFLRLMRNYPFTEMGCQHKDVAYSRGAKQVVNYLKNGKRYEDLYISKVDFKDIPIAKKVMKDEKSNLFRPKFIAERIKLTLIDPEFKHKDFRVHIKKKYKFLKPSEQKLMYKLTKKQQEYLDKICTIIRKHTKKLQTHTIKKPGH